MRNDMTTLSINLPDTIAKASQEAANKMGISRTEFIRRAVAHELKHFQKTLEEKEIVVSMIAMKESKIYLEEIDYITKGFSRDLSEDRNGWWHKEKS
jgi:metal-responsive CopG/Arc/MetJ family transcriptional regulator